MVDGVKYFCCQCENTIFIKISYSQTNPPTNKCRKFLSTNVTLLSGKESMSQREIIRKDSVELRWCLMPSQDWFCIQDWVFWDSQFKRNTNDCLLWTGIKPFTLIIKWDLKISNKVSWRGFICFKGHGEFVTLLQSKVIKNVSFFISHMWLLCSEFLFM